MKKIIVIILSIFFSAVSIQGQDVLPKEIEKLYNRNRSKDLSIFNDWLVISRKSWTKENMRRFFYQGKERYSFLIKKEGNTFSYFELRPRNDTCFNPLNSMSKRFSSAPFNFRELKNTIEVFYSLDVDEISPRDGYLLINKGEMITFIYSSIGKKLEGYKRIDKKWCYWPFKNELKIISEKTVFEVIANEIYLSFIKLVVFFIENIYVPLFCSK